MRDSTRELIVSSDDLQRPHRLVAIHAALRFVITSDMQSEHKATLIDVLTQAIRDGQSASQRREAVALSQGEWQEAEISQLMSSLDGRTAVSWQNADEYVMRLATQLHRDPASVREKAKELGLGTAVDYRSAKLLTQAPE